MINIYSGSNFNFFPVNSNYPIGANYSAIGATGARVRVSGISEPVPFMIDFAGNGDNIRGACPDTNFTAFAALNIDNYNSSDFSHLVKKFKFTLFKYALRNY
jgi:NDP-sugar pyrophosphorylase family protein